MPIIYNHQPDDIVTPPALLRIDDDSSGWWTGAQRCFASVALATVIAATSLSTALAEKIHQQLDEGVAAPAPLRVTDDYWPHQLYQKQQQPALATTAYQRLPFFPDPDEIPAGKLFGLPDESVWGTINLFNPVFSVAASVQGRQQWLFDQQEAVTTAATLAADEDFWSNPAQPLAAIASAPSFSPQPFIYDAGEMGSFVAAVFTPEEDFWPNAQPAPWQAAWSLSSLAWTQPSAFDVQDVGVPLSTRVDEDYWSLSPTGQAATYQQFSIYWPRRVAQDQADIVFVPPAAIVDEDFWPCAFTPFGTQVGARPCTQLWSDSDFISPPPFVSEDYGPNLLAVLQSAPGTAPGSQMWSDVDFVFVSAPIIDEDYWPLFASVPPRLGTSPVMASWPPWIDDSEEIAGPAPEKIPGPYWIRRNGKVQGLFGRKRWR